MLQMSRFYIRQRYRSAVEYGNWKLKLGCGHHILLVLEFLKK